MKIGDSRVIGGPGVLPLQHEGYSKGDWPLWNRASLLAVRLVGRYDNHGGTEPGDGMGWWEEDPETRGDVIGGQYWQRTSREIGGWRFAWPVRTSSESGSASSGPGSMSSTKETTGGGGIGGTGGSVTGAQGFSGFAGVAHAQSGTIGAQGFSGFAGVNGRSGSGPAGIQASFGLFGIQPGVNGATGAKVTNQKPLSNVPGQVTPDGAPKATEAATSSSSGCAVMDDALMIPVERGDWSPDNRLTTVAYQRPQGNANDLWPKFPLDWMGISLQADYEDRQEDLYFPCDPRMVAVHCHGDEAMGSLVGEMAAGFRVDEDKMARLQSGWKVARKPSGCGINSANPTLAWNIGETGCGDSFGGLVWERGAQMVDLQLEGPPRSVVQPPPVQGSKTVVPGTCPEGRYGHISQKQNGFLELDCGNDHKLGTDGDGRDIYAAHLSLNSYFCLPGGKYDGPLRHDGIAPPAGNAPFPLHVTFGYDAEIEHDFICGSRKGRHRWVAYSFMYSPITEPPPALTPGDHSWTIPPDLESPETPPRTPEPPPAVPPPSPPPPPEIDPRGPGGHYNPWNPQPAPGLPPQPGSGLNSFDPTFPPAWPQTSNPNLVKNVRPYGPEEGMLPFAATTMEMAVPAWLARPEPVSGAAQALKNDLDPGMYHVHRTVDAFTPLTGRVEAWGAQGKRTGSSWLTSSFSWAYTHRPDRYRYEGGTASGGFLVLPPEVGMEDVDSDFLPPSSGINVSTTMLAVGPGALFAAGTPDLENGGMATGYTWRDDSGTLRFASSASSVLTDRVAITAEGFAGIGVSAPTMMLQVRNPELAGVDLDVLCIESAGSTTGDSWGICFGNAGGAQARVRCIQGTGATDARLEIGTANGGTITTRLTIDEDANIGANTSAFGGGEGVIGVADRGVAPASTPSGGGVLYSESGALVWKGSSGTVTTLAPA